MTVQIIISIILLLMFLIKQRNIIQNHRSNTLQFTLNNGIVFILLPVSYSGIVVISDFLFESVNENLNWFIMVFFPLWIMNLIYAVKIIKHQKSNRLELYWMILMLLALFFWFIIAITQSHYESGSTPKITDSIYILFYFFSVHLIIISTLILQFLNWKKHFKLKKIITISLLFLYVLIFLNNLIDFLF